MAAITRIISDIVIARDSKFDIVTFSIYKGSARVRPRQITLTAPSGSINTNVERSSVAAGYFHPLNDTRVPILVPQKLIDPSESGGNIGPGVDEKYVMTEGLYLDEVTIPNTGQSHKSANIITRIVNPTPSGRWQRNP